MSHLSLVPQLAPQECRCDRPSGRYWLQGAWNCNATDALIRYYPTIGWHHYSGHQIINPANNHELEREAA